MALQHTSVVGVQRNLSQDSSSCPMQKVASKSVVEIPQTERMFRAIFKEVWGIGR